MHGGSPDIKFDISKAIMAINTINNIILKYTPVPLLPKSRLNARLFLPGVSVVEASDVSAVTWAGSDTCDL